MLIEQPLIQLTRERNYFRSGLAGNRNKAGENVLGSTLEFCDFFWPLNTYFSSFITIYIKQLFSQLYIEFIWNKRVSLKHVSQWAVYTERTFGNYKTACASLHYILGYFWIHSNRQAKNMFIYWFPPFPTRAMVTSRNSNK